MRTAENVVCGCGKHDITISKEVIRMDNHHWTPSCAIRESAKKIDECRIKEARLTKQLKQLDVVQKKIKTLQDIITKLPCCECGFIAGVGYRVEYTCLYCKKCYQNTHDVGGEG